MIILSTLVTIIIVSVVSYFIFRRWFNHVLLYTVVWGMMIVFYEARLMNYIELSPLAWFAVISAYLSFIFGSIIPLAASRKKLLPATEESGKVSDYKIFSDDGKLLKRLIISFSLIGLLGAIQHWMILLNMFGSIQSILINANEIYRLRVEGKLPGLIPYIYLFSYAAVFLSSIFIARSNRISFISVLPFIGVLLKEIANVGRAGILMCFLLFISTYFLYKNSTKNSQASSFGWGKMKMAMKIVVVLIFIVATAGFIRSSRGTIENFQASSRQLNELRGGLLITPSIYLYLSSHIGVFSKFIDKDYNERNYFGEKTFQPVYNVLAKFDVVKHPGFYPKGYFIPMWSNTATYLRELLQDFGPAGILILPFMLGLFCSILYEKVQREKNIIVLLSLSYLFVLVLYSPIVLISHHAIWALSFVMLLIALPLTEKLILKR